MGLQITSGGSQLRGLHWGSLMSSTLMSAIGQLTREYRDGDTHKNGVNQQAKRPDSDADEHFISWVLHEFGSSDWSCGGN